MHPIPSRVIERYIERTDSAMAIIKTIFIVIQLIICISLICIIILQTGKNSGLSALSGQSDTYLARNKQKSRDVRLALATKWFAGGFVILTVVLNII